MIEYIYFVKCPNCEDEHFYLLNDAKECAMSQLSKKPIITQTEVNRNDFGECIDFCDLGTVWSWEDEVQVADDRPVSVTFHKADLEHSEEDPEFAAIDNSVDYTPSEAEIETAFHSDDVLDRVPDNFHKPISENAIQDGGFRTKGYRTALACYDSDDFDVNVEFGMQDEDEYEVEDQLYLLRPGQTVADLVVYLSRKCGFTNVYVYGETGAYGNERKTAARFETVPGTHDYRHYGTIEDRLVEKCDKKARKPIPEGMTIEQLVEEMEENEDDVECRRCTELFDKSECIYDRDYGWLCTACHGGDLNMGEAPLTESSKYKNSVEFHYDTLTTTITTGVIPATLEDPEDYWEGEYTDEFDFEVETNTVEEVLWDFLTEEDVSDVPGGLEALEDDAAWRAFLDVHFEELLEKYNDKFLEYFKEDAEEAAKEEFQERYAELYSEGPDPDHAYDKRRDERYFGESVQKPFLEEFDDAETHKANLTDCPECGTVSYDMKEQYCYNCGLGL